MFIPNLKPKVLYPNYRLIKSKTCSKLVLTIQTGYSRYIHVEIFKKEKKIVEIVIKHDHTVHYNDHGGGFGYKTLSIDYLQFSNLIGPVVTIIKKTYLTSQSSSLQERLKITRLYVDRILTLDYKSFELKINDSPFCSPIDFYENGSADNLKSLSSALNRMQIETMSETDFNSHFEKIWRKFAVYFEAPKSFTTNEYVID